MHVCYAGEIAMSGLLTCLVCMKEVWHVMFYLEGSTKKAGVSLSDEEWSWLNILGSNEVF